MKLLLLLFFGLVFGGQFLAQEIEHKHNTHYALIENKGQWAEKVLFQSKSQGNNIWVQQHGFLYDLRDYSPMKRAHLGNSTDTSTEIKSALSAAHFLNSNEVYEIIKEKPLPYYYNYFLGNDSTKWTSDVRSFNEVTLKNFYNGIDLKVFDTPEKFKYELWCSPGSPINNIQIDLIHFQQISIAKNGDLILKTSLGEIIEQKPIAYQLLNGKLTEILCAFKLNGSILSFQLGKYNPLASIIIDPVLIFATYSGSPSDNFGMTATYGYDGTAYSAGTIYGNAYPTPDNSAYDITSTFTALSNPTYGITDVFVSKYSPDGEDMLWTTFLGGGSQTQGTETAHSLICDRNNNLYIYGATSSTNFPMVNAYQPTHAGGAAGANFTSNGVHFNSPGTDIYVSKISANGHNLLASTYVGGSLNDGVNMKSGANNYDSLTTNYGDNFRGEIMLDSLGNCLIASSSRSNNFPVLNAFQPTKAGQQDGVIFKLTSNLSTMLWSSYFGGTDNDACYSVKIDSSYNIVFSGGTSSTNIPGTTGGLNPNYLGGKADGFVGKLTPNGQTLIQSTYIGANQYDQAFFVEINRNDEIFILGQSVGGNFPVINSQSYPNSSQFIAKLNPNLTTVLNSTVFGNGSPNINISPAAFLVDICGNMYVSGWGASILQANPLSGMPVSSDAYQSSSGDGFNFYLFVYKRDFSGLLYGSYLGGGQAQEHVDGGTSRFDKNGVVYQSVCGGCQGYSDFPTTPNAWSNQNLSSNCNNIVFKFDFQLLPKAEFNPSGLGGCEDYTVTLTNTSSPSDSYEWDLGNGTTSTVFSPTVTYTDPGVYIVKLRVTDSICLITDTNQITITVLPDIQLSVSNDTILCSPLPMTFTANSSGSADYFIWSTNSQFTDTLNVSVADSTLTVTPSQTTTYYINAGNAACSKIDSVTVYFVGGSLVISGNDSICLNDPTTLTANINVPGITFNYVWSPLNILTTTGQQNVVIANPPTSQWVYVDASGSNGCFDRDSIYVTVGTISGAVNAQANPEYIVPGGASTLTASPSGYSYFWIPPTNLSNPLGQITEATPPQTTIYTVNITDGICTKSASVKVNVLEVVCDRTYVFIPNAFSPNGDLENDVLYVRSVIATKILFRIFDRWGEMVFETTDQNSGWDGTFRGKLLKPDTYDYYLEATCVQGEQKIIKGNVTLIR
ncbi:T9SS type B sorting domain-containing protein [Fluviicola taffensis]|uniref:PKD domain containing protein n=1 Tax=Fluviicola taffensis (strain DSM 16823 / NCIMB 13979 / RW262) TaxID=755732 RepID=F2ID14_FLUTR|nr:T9SS type B sorting domain-containing protein [Fluviicola taffensis]AEA44408.1 PKD domain containing protein [Fluviicola taffensis DSM 16823]